MPLLINNTVATYNYGLGVKGLHGVPESKLDPLVFLRVLKNKVLTAKGDDEEDKLKVIPSFLVIIINFIPVFVL